MYIGFHVKYPLCLSGFKKLEFSRQIFKKSLNIKFHKIRSVGAELFHADRQTDRHDEANSRFSQFCEGAEDVIRIKYTLGKKCEIFCQIF